MRIGIVISGTLWQAGEQSGFRETELRTGFPK